MNRFEIALGKEPPPPEPLFMEVSQVTVPAMNPQKFFKAIWGEHPEPQDIFMYAPYIPLVVSRVIPEGIYRTIS
jgi:hypothetical protein